MKEKYKAKELFDKYCHAIRTEETDSGYFTNVIYAKQCALIAVNEIIDSSPMYYTGFEFESNLEYWQQVKTEIKKLKL